ncbi:MAG TPA: AMP-binding protein [Cyclobacteriaceae bacterium]|nr:AMP-binding protein [Cyclobacteriaceae bacterium]
MTSRLWHQHYPEYMPKEIESPPFNSLAELCEVNCKQFAQLPAFENMDKQISYAELDQLATNFGSFLHHDCKLVPGDRIAIQMPNIIQFGVAMIGALKAGLIVVNTNPLYTPREMEHQFKDSGAVAIVILANFAHNLDKVLGETSIRTIIITEVGDLMGGLKKHIVNFMVKHVKKMVHPYHLPGAISFSDALARGAQKKFITIPRKKEDTAFLQYTGGTTGLSKGAELTHGNVLSNIWQVMPVLKELQRGPLVAGDVAVIPLPMYHIYALTTCFVFFNTGLCNRLITNPRDFAAFIKILKKPFHTMIGVNTLYNALLNHPNFGDINFTALKGCNAGGMALQEVVFKRWKEKTGISIGEGYGLSETSPVLTFQITGKERMGSIGVPIPSTDIKMMDDDGREVPVGEAGELCASGPQVFKGYWQKDNSSVFHPGGWFKTGDIAVQDPDGYIRIVDRKKDMILVSGFNVYPNEIEGVIATHPKVLEVAAIGIPDPACGEAVKICIVKKDPSLTEDEIREFCKETLTGYKRPKHVQFLNELPKTNVGKILRRALRDTVAA